MEEISFWQRFSTRARLGMFFMKIMNSSPPIRETMSLAPKSAREVWSDAGFLFNNFHIRHNNKVGAKAQDYISTVKDSDLEEWYDKAYEVALSVIIINDYLTIKQDIVDIKSKYTWRP